MAKITINLPDDLDEWLMKQIGNSGKSRPAKVVELLDMVRKRDAVPDETNSTASAAKRADDHPSKDAANSNDKMLRRIAETLDLLFQKHLADHPRVPLTDHEIEVVEERWETVKTIRDGILKQ